MSVHLAVIAVEQVETLPVRIARGAELFQTLLANSCCRIPLFFQNFSDGYFRVGNRVLPGKYASFRIVRSVF